MILRKRQRRAFANTAAASGWAESTHAEVAWDKSRGAGLRWALGGIVVGTALALIAFAPAAWLARGLAAASKDRVLLADARGTVWSGSAVAVLTGGPGSRDAAALPGRLEWSIGLRGLGLEVQARHACCLNGTVALLIKPGFGRVTTTLLPTVGWVGQWPSAWLGGLGTPFNTMQLGGAVRLVSPGMTLATVQGRVQLQGRADVELLSVSSRLTTLDTLGSYRLTLAGADAGAPGPSTLTLSTQEGALQLSGNGTWGPGGVRFRGEATATGADEPALANLLNIIGRREGARSVISIG
jgi:general secretion pathway protein N